MYYYEVAPTKIVRAGVDVFTYHSTSPLTHGLVVRIPIGKTSCFGIVMRSVSQPSFVTREITDGVIPVPLPGQLIATAQWMSTYYATPLSLVLSSILPRGIDKKRRDRTTIAKPSIREHKVLTPNIQQQAAIDTITQSSQTTHLLVGVTGSGKTLVYKELAKQALARGQSAIILVPEIALTSQLVDEFLQEFPTQTLLAHSQQTEAERHQIWQQALISHTPFVAIGPRSALFLPLKNIGLIVVDEMHEPSYKQEQSPRYSALRVATILAGAHKAKVVFGSATPPVAEFYTAMQANAPIVTLAHRAHAQAVAPTTMTIDMTKRANFTQHRFFSDALLARMTSTLLAGKQVLLFHNRRGSAAVTLCENCGWTAADPETGTPLTLHADLHKLIGHISGYTMPVPTSCPECHHSDIIHKGIGTKLIETEITKLFPNKKIVRFDGDAGKDHSVDSRYKELYDGDIDIIIGTQVIAKGIDLPHLETVGIIQADVGLGLPDFTSNERTFQLIAQAVGRVGRTDKPTSVIVQTYQPSHAAIQDGVRQNYSNFYDSEITHRKQYSFPPFSYLLKFVCAYKTEAAAISNARKFTGVLRTKLLPRETLLGPTPAFYEKQAGTYRWQITVRSPKRAHLIELIAELPTGSHWQYEIDPISLLS